METNQREQKHPLPWLNLMVTEPFYLFHFLTFFSYFVVRSSATQILPPDSVIRLIRWEIQAILAFSVLFIVKLVKEETWEAFIADALLFAKGFLIMLALAMDYRLALWYMLETLLTEGNTSRLWLVEFRASCSSTCIRASRHLSDLSHIYANANLSFGMVDLGHFPNAAEKFGISLGVNAGQLPTYILFDNVVEVARFPEVDFEGKASVPTITKSLLCRQFELDRRLIEYASGK